MSNVTITSQTLTLLRAMASAIKGAANARAFYVDLYANGMDAKDVLEHVDCLNEYKNKPAVRKLLASASGARKAYNKDAEKPCGWHFTSSKGVISVCSGDPTARGKKEAKADDKPKGKDKAAVALTALEALNAELQAKVEALESELLAAQARTLIIASGSKIDSKSGRVTVNKEAQAALAELIAIAA